MVANKRQKQICVVGLGYIGLPTACILATSGYRVVGVDTDTKVLEKVQSASLVDPEPDLQNLLISAIQNGNFKTSNEVFYADIYIIAVSTFLNSSNQPDISHVNAALDAISPYLGSNSLVLIESTCPIGATEIIAKKLKNHCNDISIAYCPERALPGNILYELIYNDRIVGGVDEISTARAVTFYQSFVRGEVLATDVRTAEAVKLAENAYRDINIAYANELSMIADQVGLNINELIRLANRHPRVQILNPGPGVGGRCIALNPWFLVSSAPDVAILTAKAREVNINKVNWVINKIRVAIKKSSASVVTCLGLSYKPNTSDIRESPACMVVQALKKEIQVLCVDPYIADTEELYNALARADLVVSLVAHNEFLNIPPHCLIGKTVLDFAGIFK